MKKVLFVCIHNSARSQMAEAFMNKHGKGKFVAESAGLEPGKLNPDVVKVMREIGIDISGNKTKDVYEFSKEGREYDYVITVCDEASGERCPYFPGGGKRLNWSFEDPSSLKGYEDEKLNKIRNIRDEIESKVKKLIEKNVL
jgi:arsenate reductase